MALYYYKASLYINRRKVYDGIIDCLWHLGDDENIIFARDEGKQYRVIEWVRHGKNPKLKVVLLE